MPRNNNIAKIFIILLGLLILAGAWLLFHEYNRKPQIKPKIVDSCRFGTFTPNADCEKLTASDDKEQLTNITKPKYLKTFHEINLNGLLPMRHCIVDCSSPS